MTKSAMRGVPVILQDAQTTGNGLIIAVPSSFKNHTILIQGGAGVNAGAIQVETATEHDYAGTWAKFGGNPVTVLADTELLVQGEGIVTFLRARISTTVTGGTVTVVYVGS